MSRNPAVLARAAEAVIVADVAAIDDRDRAARSYRLLARSSWKTRLHGPVIVRSESTTCRAELKVGRRYLVYLKRIGRAYWTDACAGNLPIEGAVAAMKGLGKPG